MAVDTRTLSRRAQEIFRRVCDELQAADELGGLDEPQDYQRLMTSVIEECERRRRNCIAWSSAPVDNNTTPSRGPHTS